MQRLRSVIFAAGLVPVRHEAGLSRGTELPAAPQTARDVSVLVWPEAGSSRDDNENQLAERLAAHGAHNLARFIA